MQPDWGAHASRVQLTASRRHLRYHILPHHLVHQFVKRNLRRDAANHTPEACAPHFLLHRSGLVKVSVTNQSANRPNVNQCAKAITNRFGGFKDGGERMT
jgi:hypothetical protein